MKVIKVVGHPVLVMCMYLLILISGEQFGGFYLLYVVMGLPYGAPHALIALAGLSTMFVGYKIHPKRIAKVKPLLYFLGNLLMATALFIFFSNSKGYNNSTFKQIVPLISLGLYCISLLSNLVLILLILFKMQNQNDKSLETAT